MTCNQTVVNFHDGFLNVDFCGIFDADSLGGFFDDIDAINSVGTATLAIQHAGTLVFTSRLRKWGVNFGTEATVRVGRTFDAER